MRRIMLCYRVRRLRRMRTLKAKGRENGKKNTLVGVIELVVREGGRRENKGSWQTAAEKGVINDEGTI